MCEHSLVTLHSSCVQALESSQSAFDVQQPATLVCEHVLVERSHLSVVQVCESLQSPSLAQQPATVV